MTLETSCAVLPYVGVYVTLNQRGSVVREQVGFADIREYRVWVVAMRETYPNANFACFQVTARDLVSLD
jgi:hypothetical protein